MSRNVGSLSLLLLAAVGVLAGGCVVTEEHEEMGGTESAVVASMQAGAPTDLPEVVQVLVNNAAQDYCTGVLVSPTRVLTATHCTGGKPRSFTIKAPNAPGAPTRTAQRTAVVHHSSNFNEEIEKEDATILDFSEPIQLPRFPELRDVGDLGERTLTAVAVGRSEENRNAPLVKSKPITVHAGELHGYTTGVSTEFYSSGGDSGGPLFLWDAANKRPTHVLIGIERQPDGDFDRFTRITPAVQRLVAR